MQNLLPQRAFHVTATALAIATTLFVSASCAPKASQSDAMTAARLEASETKLAQIEERLASLESKTGRLDGVAEGVKILLEKLDTLGGQNASGSSSEPERKLPSSTAVYSVPIDGDPFVGPEFAKVTMIKGYDFYCTFCDRVRPVLADLRTIYGDDLKIVYKNFVIHDDYARLPALAACAAHKQGKFMPMFEQIWIKGIRARAELTESKLLAIATDLKLNKKRLLADMYGSCEDKIQSDFQAMSAVGASGTPAFYINGRFIAGALPITRFRRIIDQEMEKANRSIKSGIKLKDYYRHIVDSGRKSL